MHTRTALLSYCVALAALLGACGLNPGKGRPTAASLGDLTPVTKRLLSGPDTLRIEIVELKGKRALVRILGSSDLFAGKVLPAKIVDARTGLFTTRYYEVKLRGRESAIFYSRGERNGMSWRYLGISHHANQLHLHDRASATERERLSAEGLASEHQKQHAAGQLAFTEYDRKWWLSSLKEDVNAALAALESECGYRPKSAIPWERIGDPLILQHGSKVIQHCTDTLRSIGDLCKDYLALERLPVREVFGTIKVVSCDPTQTLAVKFAEGTLSHGSSPEKEARVELRKVELRPQHSLGTRLSWAASAVCFQGDHQLILRAERGPRFDMPTLCYGKDGHYSCTGELLRYSTSHCRPFYDPRFAQQDNGRLRSKACIQVDWKGARCRLRCGGDKEKELKLATAPAAREIFEKAKFARTALGRIPHALARDARGTYYYVDRSAKRDIKDYRVFIGRRGKLARQKMVDVVDDSEGQVFETSRGKLRLIVGKGSGQWVERKRSRKLLLVPIKNNLPLIHRELGVYWGKRLNTPCDDF